MSKKTPISPEELENALECYFTEPEPNPEFATWLESGLRSKLIEQESYNMFGKKSRLSPRIAWGLGLALAILIIGLLATSPTIVAAMKRLLGYIPGVGVVEQGAQLRVLAEPVSQTRDGVTITVTEAVLSADKTVVVYTVENVPFENLSHREDIPGCVSSAEIRLPDGIPLQITSGGGEGWGSGYENRFTYVSIPADVNAVTLFVPCIQDTLPGMLPENWELPLRFVPAPSDMTVMPVFDVTPEVGTNNPADAPNPLRLEKVIETQDGYILIGSFDSRIMPENQRALGLSKWPTITDANGQDVFYSTANDVDAVSNEIGVFPWAYEIKGKQHAWPLSIKLEAIEVELPTARVSFEFDTGPNPQVDQVWTVSQQISLGDYNVEVVSIRFTGDGYSFSLKADPAVRWVNVEIEGFIATSSSGGGDGQGLIEASLSYEGTLPTGLLKVNVFSPTVELQGRWQLQWQPDLLVSAAPATSEEPLAPPDSQTCLTFDSMQAALVNPQPLPADLSGKLIVYGHITVDGQSPSPDNYGVFVTSLDGTNQQVLGQGVWPSISPDGTKAAYAWDNGLYITVLASRQSYLVPGTNSNDYSPRWSPHGNRIAFVRIDDFNLYIINPDGSGLQKVTDGIEYEQLVDWSPDGKSIYYSYPVKGGNLLKKIDLATGTIQDLFTVSSKGPSVAISPDGNWIAAVERIGDSFQFGLYLSRPDGSERRLLAQLDHWGIAGPVWSPDGKWLLFTVMNTDLYEPTENPTLLNLSTCQAFPLTFEGNVQGWAR